MRPPPEEIAPAHGPDGASFDALEVLRDIVKQKWLVLGIAGAVSILVLFWTLGQPKVYRAEATLQYDPHPMSPLEGEIHDVADPVGSYWATKEFFKTQNEILKSRTVAERVVRELGLHHDPSFMYIPEDERGSWDGVETEVAARVLQGRLEVEQEPDTRLVRVLYEDRNPERAAAIVNAVITAYIEKTLEDRAGTTVSALDWLSAQLDDINERLESSELALHRFKEQNDLLSVSLQDRQNIAAANIQHFNDALAEARTRRIQLTARLQRLRDANEDNPLEVKAAIVANNDAIVSLRRQYQERAAERDALSTRYGQNHPRLQAVEQELSTLREQMRSEIEALITSAELELREIRNVEQGLQRTLDEANRLALQVNLGEIEYRRLSRQRENNEKLYGVLLERTTETKLTKLLRVSPARLVDPALVPRSPVKPKVTLNAIVGTIIGILLGLGVAFLRSRMDRTVGSIEEVEALGVTVLGVLPQMSEDDNAASSRPAYGRGKRVTGATSQELDNRDLIVHTRPMSAVAESCRTLRTNVVFASPDNPPETLVVTSPGPREGKTTVAVSLAISMAQSGKRVLLIDTDMRRPRIHRTFGISNRMGITSVLVGEHSLHTAVSDTAVPNLLVLPCGPIPPNPSELLHTERFHELLESARADFDRVILDSPPLGVVTDAAIIAPQTQGALLVLKANGTTREAASSVLRQLRDVRARVLGAVLNFTSLGTGRYGYQYYYHYYGPDPGDETNDVAAE